MNGNVIQNLTAITITMSKKSQCQTQMAGWLGPTLIITYTSSFSCQPKVVKPTGDTVNLKLWQGQISTTIMCICGLCHADYGVHLLIKNKPKKGTHTHPYSSKKYAHIFNMHRWNIIKEQREITLLMSHQNETLHLQAFALKYLAAANKEGMSRQSSVEGLPCQV